MPKHKERTVRSVAQISDAMLTDHEYALGGRRLARMVRDLVAMEKDKKDVVADFTKQIQEKREAITRLADAIYSGQAQLFGDEGEDLEQLPEAPPHADGKSAAAGEVAGAN